MTLHQEDRHWKIAKPDLSASVSAAPRILSTRRVVDRETKPEKDQNRPGRKESIRFPLIHHVRLTPCRSLDKCGGHRPPLQKITRNYPTEPSISSSIRRLSSTLYSIGNWRTRSLTKPLTLRLMACASLSPRCCM